MSDDLVPINVACVLLADQTHAIFHITAYNSKIDKILDVKLTQPGTKLGQASDCFIYWKDPLQGERREVLFGS